MPAFRPMDATQKWLAGIGGAILCVLVPMQLYFYSAIRSDMAAMEQRLSASISEVAETLRGQDNRFRDAEVTTAVNEALAKMAVEVSTNRASQLTANNHPNAEESPPAS